MVDYYLEEVKDEDHHESEKNSMEIFVVGGELFLGLQLVVRGRLSTWEPLELPRADPGDRKRGTFRELAHQQVHPVLRKRKNTVDTEHKLDVQNVDESVRLVLIRFRLRVITGILAPLLAVLRVLVVVVEWVEAFHDREKRTQDQKKTVWEPSNRLPSCVPEGESEIFRLSCNIERVETEQQRHKMQRTLETFLDDFDFLVSEASHYTSKTDCENRQYHSSKFTAFFVPPGYYEQVHEWGEARPFFISELS